METKYYFLLPLLLLVGFNTFAQIRFEPGYFIDNNNDKTECLIKNLDWKNNPDAFEYKLSESGELQRATIKSVREFGINGQSKFIRAKVKIDLSSSVSSKLSVSMAPDWSEREIFLKVLTEGKSSLYYYEDGNLIRFFYKTDDSPIRQLVYKQYLVNGTELRNNNTYRQQLFMDVNCGGKPADFFKRIDYNWTKLNKYFRSYNECAGGGFVDYDDRKKRQKLNLKITPGISKSSLAIRNALGIKSEFDDQITFRVGLELEYVLPLNKNKWAIVVEPTYRYFETNQEFVVVQAILDVNARYNSIEVPMGLRHYFFLNERFRVFLNAFLVLDYSFDSLIDYPGPRDLEVTSRGTFSYGIGANYGRFSTELRVYVRKDITFFSDSISDFNKSSLIFGYRIF